MLADACHLTRDVKLAERLYPALLPWAARFVWLGPLTGCIDPPFARSLGLLAETLGNHDDAIRHLEDAEARTAKAGMRGHYARLWYELARALFARGGPGDRERGLRLIDEARALASELGQVGLLPQLAALVAPASARAPSADPRATRPAPHPPRLSLRRERDTWRIAWGERTLQLRDSRGLALLARLVDNAGCELHVLQLAADGDEPRDVGDAGPALDAAAVQSYRQRLLELRDELHDAEERGHADRAERAREEIEFLTRELARAVGMGGRERRAGHAAERARTAVQKRIREAIRRIEADVPELGKHLHEAVRTGVFCGYLPGRRNRGG
jgi:hypothetical protein